jgi:hypothetical protein
LTASLFLIKQACLGFGAAARAGVSSEAAPFIRHQSQTYEYVVTHNAFDSWFRISFDHHLIKGLIIGNNRVSVRGKGLLVFGVLLDIIPADNEETDNSS